MSRSRPVQLELIAQPARKIAPPTPHEKESLARLRATLSICVRTAAQWHADHEWGLLPPHACRWCGVTID